MTGLWILILLLLLPMPLLMIIFGVMFMNQPPEHIGGAFGYRTRRSMINIDTWIFAHRYFGRLWLIIGAALIPATIIAMLPFLGSGEDPIMNAYLVITIVHVIAMLLPIGFTECALKRNFDELGRRK